MPAMKLTGEQQAILDGARGPLAAEHMRLLIEWGEAFAAARLVPVQSVMANGLSVPNRTLGDVPYELIEGYIEYCRRCLELPVAVPTVAQVGCLDLRRAEQHQSDMRQVPAQRELLQMGTRAGVAMAWTCAPYLIGYVPLKGQVCAWTESHAVVLLNSVLGARTTRHGNESAIAAAVTGWTPEFGVLLDENRSARVAVRVEVELRHDTDWGALGFFAGRLCGLHIPAFAGVPPPQLEAARQLAAALATSGGAPMFHIAGVTPEAPTLEAALHGQLPEKTVPFGLSDLAGVYDELTTLSGEEVDFVYFGCPHATLQELLELALGLRSRRVHPNVLLLVSTSYATEMQARRLGIAQEIEAAGGQFMTDTCPTNALWPKPQRMVTPNVKNCVYSRNLLGCEVALASPAECVETAVIGRHHRAASCE